MGSLYFWVRRAGPWAAEKVVENPRARPANETRGPAVAGVRHGIQRTKSCSIRSGRDPHHPSSSTQGFAMPTRLPALLQSESPHSRVTTFCCTCNKRLSFGRLLVVVAGVTFGRHQPEPDAGFSFGRKLLASGEGASFIARWKERGRGWSTDSRSGREARSFHLERCLTSVRKGRGGRCGQGGN
jgi:hypothetical protein